MSSRGPYVPDPRLDLVLQRVVDVTPERVWRAWTRPEYVTQWFAPAPWVTSECQIDLRPGGVFRTVMRGPEGEEMVNVGCYLEVVAPDRLVWTGGLLPGFRPAAAEPWGAPVFTAVLTFEAHGPGTLYTAVVLHRDAEGRQTHAEMGFEAGWGAALDQLVDVCKAM